MPCYAAKRANVKEVWAYAKNMRCLKSQLQVCSQGITIIGVITIIHVTLYLLGYTFVCIPLGVFP